MELIKYSLVYTADSIRKFDSKSNRTADSIRYSIRTQKNDSQVPKILLRYLEANCSLKLLFSHSIDSATSTTLRTYHTHRQNAKFYEF